jgi:DNA-binding response OmpR family regulator
MSDEKIRILVVDDEADIRKVLRLLLQSRGYEVIEAANGKIALNTIENTEVDLIIMDVMMPQMSGIEATAEIRRITTAPILFLTAKSMDSDKELAYRSGGDDYLVKPFSSSELLLKVESLLRRYIIYKGKDGEDSSIVSLAGGVEVDVKKRTVRKNGENPCLRDKEYELFFYLFDHRGEVIDSDTIFEAVWNEKALPSSANNVMVNMLGLRKKLEDDPSAPEIIKTVWGKGYRFE